MKSAAILSFLLLRLKRLGHLHITRKSTTIRSGLALLWDKIAVRSTALGEGIVGLPIELKSCLPVPQVQTGWICQRLFTEYWSAIATD